ncbi:phage tail sheath C-terminal domain-containing protein [Anaerotignum sp. MB30-C6]|uniref:phage tail sheath C-terminal domain-containing protein n=1 Tax=Anaerotignum sp. MB30-C6 TaxID=3070814 RepID=UPI0027DD62F4|nr:phage tail sheath C-terminal domain-containing protein [Anaerotignum sp. MB30-C6]WMI80903.1 phage tail sheath C-terminal domain-containing protein [Anaerotignum sp. MB30-C6]
MIKLPSIEVIFKQKATSLIKRSARGIAILIVKDDTVKDDPDKSFSYKEYKNITAAEAEKDNYTAENMQYIRDVFGFTLNKVCIVRIDAVGGTVADALVTLERNIKTGWVTIAGGTPEDFTTLSSWAKTKETERKSYKSVCYKATAPDCKHIVNFYNDKVIFADKRGEVTGEKYCPSLLGILASSNVMKSVTNFHCANLVRVLEVVDSEKAVGEGKFVLLNDVDKVRIALGNNSMTTTDGLNATEDMKFIDIVEVMDLINDDISDVFKNEYLGKYKNIYNNQVLFISAINTYFKELARDYILDPNYTNKADVDADTQRLAWVGTGKAEAEDWDDQTVKNNAFKRTVYLLGDIKISGAMENLKFVVNLA